MGSALCEHCRAELPGSTQRRRFGDARFRAAAWQAARRDREGRLRDLVRRPAKEAGEGSEVDGRGLRMIGEERLRRAIRLLERGRV